MDACRIAKLCEARHTLESGEPVRIDAIARTACISPYHFIREYESLFGQTPHQHRLAARMQRAKQMLARGEHSVSDVCFDLGMSSLGSFSAWFQRHAGLSPRDYQRQTRTVVGVLPIQHFPGCLSLIGQLPADAFRNFREASARA